MTRIDRLKAGIDRGRIFLRQWVLSAVGEPYRGKEPRTVRHVEARAGAWTFAALYVLSLLQSGPWTVLGLADSEALGRLRALFLGQRMAVHMALLVGYLALGWVFGLVVRQAWILVGEHAPAWARGRFPRRRRSLVAAGGVLFFHGAFLWTDLARRPALYQEGFYDRGGILRGLQVLAADYGFGVFTLIYQLLAGIVVAGAVLQSIRPALVRMAGFRLSPRAALALLVSGGGTAVFLAGLYAVFRFQAPSNRGPNVVLIAVESLRSDALTARNSGGPLAPHMARLAREGQFFSACIPPVAAPAPSLMTLWTGRSPLSHGVRHSFPAAEDLRFEPDDLPALLRRYGYATAVTAGHGGDFFSRVRPAFDRVKAPDGRFSVLLRQRILKSHAHLLPYMSGRLGQHLFPSLRNAPELSDPTRVAEEAEDFLKSLARQDKFFLTAYFSGLGPPHAVAPGFARHVVDRSYRGPFKYAVPAAGAPGLLGQGDHDRLRRLYQANVLAVDQAVGRILRALRDHGLDETTVVALWSPYAEQLFERGFGHGHGRHLRGPEMASAPFVLVEPRLRAGPREVREPIRAVDVAPTLLSVLGLPVPASMEGIPATARPFGEPPDEAFAAYAETDVWPAPDPGGFTEARRIPYPEVAEMMDLDFWGDGRLRLDVRNEDEVLVAKHRMIQWGAERLIYAPTRHGVRYELYDFSTDPEGVHDLAQTPSGAKRVQELREALFRYLAREAGWRPQNGYWIPEAFLRE
jgi:arylsulfatase A-like enzyme